MAEAIWKASSSIANLNRILIGIHGFNQFTFNVSVILLLAAYGRLTSKHKTDKLPLLNADAIYDHIASLDVVKSKTAKQTMCDFLSLFQIHQGLLMLPSSRDQSIADLLMLKTKQMKGFQDHLKNTMETLNKSIRDQQDLSQNILVRLVGLIILKFAHYLLFFCYRSFIQSN